MKVCRHSLRPIVLVATVALTAACASTPHGTLGIGVNKVGLTLAFADKALSTGPVPPAAIVGLIPAPPGLKPTASALAQYAVPTNAPTPKPADPAHCAAAPKGAPKPPPAPPGVAAPPQEGYYRIVNSGTIKVTTDGITLQFPYPAVSTMQIKGVSQSTNLPLEPQATSVTDYTAITTVSPTDVITEHIQYTPTEIDLVSRSEKNSGTVTADTFTPAVKIYDSQGSGAKWDAVGTDGSNGRVMNFNGAINSEPVVNACGALLSTYAVTSTSTLVDAQNRTESGTTTGQSDVQDIATGIGGLIVHQELHLTEAETVNGAAVTIEIDLKSTLDGHAPSATPPPGTAGS